MKKALFISCIYLLLSHLSNGQGCPAHKFTDGGSWEFTNYKNCKEESKTVSTVLRVVKTGATMSSTIREEYWTNGKKESEFTYEIKCVNKVLLTTCCEIVQMELAKQMLNDPEAGAVSITCIDSLKEAYPELLRAGLKLSPAYSRTIFKIKSDGNSDMAVVSTRQKINRVAGNKQTVKTPAGNFTDCWVIDYEYKMQTSVDLGKEMEELMKGMGGTLPADAPKTVKRRQYYDPKTGTVIKEVNRNDECEYGELTRLK
jgi:hypothetical protein